MISVAPTARKKKLQTSSVKLAANLLIYRAAHSQAYKKISVDKRFRCNIIAANLTLSLQRIFC